jgi:hypothetical protein
MPRAAPWTSETSPRNGGRRKGQRDRINVRIEQAVAAFLEGDETHEAYDLTAWLKKLADSMDAADHAVVARFLGQFIETDVNISATVTHAALVASAGEIPQAVVDAALEALQRIEAAREPALMIEAEAQRVEPPQPAADEIFPRAVAVRDPDRPEQRPPVQGGTEDDAASVDSGA